MLIYGTTPDMCEESSRSSMAERPEKLARLQSLRDRLPFISQSALHSILQIAKREELPDIGHRGELRHARDAIAHTMTPYGKICQTLPLRNLSGAEISVEFQNPFAMLHHSCSTSRALTSLMKRCVEKQPPSLARPWNIVLYADEVTPGNQLAYKNSRKFWAVYWSVLEWGPRALADEDAKQTGIHTSLNSQWQLPPCMHAFIHYTVVLVAFLMLQHRYRISACFVGSVVRVGLSSHRYYK